MDMDQRQKQITSSAGLEESKYNVEFIDFLKRWGTPILLVVAICSMGFFFYRRYEERRASQVDQAWVELEDARVSRSPASLIAVAEAHAGELGVPQQARLAAADVMFISAVQGVKPGGLTPAGELTGTDALLTAEGRSEQLTAALEQYTIVADQLANKRYMQQLRITAMFGIAAAQESLDKWDDAATTLKKIVVAANEADFPAQAAAAQKRIDTMDDAKNAPRLYAAADVKTTKPKPVPAPAGGPDAASPLGAIDFGTPGAVSLEPTTSVTPMPSPDAAAPVPAPPPAAPPAPATPPATEPKKP
ncbi:MAG: hypothetical protein ACKVS8_13980 [Phycisphaerales bacterium]